MILTAEFWIGALAGAVVVLAAAWWLWGRKAGALPACQEQVKTLQAAKAQLEGEAAGMKTALALQDADRDRLEREKAAVEAVMLRNQSERSHLEGTVSRLQVEKSTINADFDRIKFDNQKLRERLVKVEDALQNAETAMSADLTTVNGIAPALAYRLNRAGVWSLSDLGTISPQRLADLEGSDGAANGINALKIIQAARDAAGLPFDNLERIDGIGPVIARLLYDACIFTFADLGRLSPEQLRAILGARIKALSDEESMLAQARELAAAA